MKVFLGILLFIVYSESVVIQYEPCDGALKSRSKISEVAIEPCAHIKDGTCDIPEGADSTIIIHFNPSDSDITDITTKIEAFIGIKYFPYPIDAKLKDACKSGALKCPPKHGSDNEYRFSLLVGKLYPKIGLSLRWSLLDEKNRVQACVKFPISVV